MNNTSKIAWSDFSFKKEEWKFSPDRRHVHATGHFRKDLVDLVKKYWKNRVPGVGRKDLKKVVVVPIPEVDKFNCNWMDINDATHITGKVVKRQPFEDPFVALKGRVSRARQIITGHTYETLPVKFIKIVLYSADTLLEDGGKRSSDADWEIVAILTGPWDNEPMTPLTMARNFLRKPGGTFAPYTAKQFAESIYFWSQFIQARRS